MTGPVARVRRRWEQADVDVRRYTRSVAIAGAASFVLYVLVLWDFAPDPLRTAFPSGDFSGFFDMQARRLMGGHLDVPKGDLGIEAFVRHGREYMYFPPGPALLRIPVFLVTHRFDGKLTALSMLVAWLGTAVLVALTMWRVRRVLRGTAPLGRGEAIGFGVLLAVICSGSVLLFLASLPYVYHEVYAWAILCAIGAAHCLLGMLERPTRRGVVSAGLFTLGAILTRTTAGWACAGALLLAALWFVLGRARRPIAAHLVRGLVLAALVPLAIGVAINWAKFEHPYMFPLEDQIWTSINDHRAEALEANGGDLVSVDILPSTAVNYFRPDGIRFTRVFPFITLPARIAPAYGDSFLDQTYRTGSVVPFMPLLMVLGTWGVIAAFRPRGAPGAALVRIPMLGAAAIPGAIMFYGYIANRYTSELLPLLVFASAVGYVDLARRLSSRGPTARKVATGVVALLGAFGLVANLAVSIATARVNSPGAPQLQYLRLQERISSLTPGDPLVDLIAAAPALPDEGAADRLQIVGDCHALYVGLGDPLAPWSMVEAKQLAWDVDVSGLTADDEVVTIPLAQPDDLAVPGLVLKVSPFDRFRVQFDGGPTAEEVERSRWRRIPDDGHLHVTMAVNLGRQEYAVFAGGGRRSLIDFSAAQLGRDGFRQMLVMRDVSPRAATSGIAAHAVPTADLVACGRLRAKAGLG